MAAITFERPSTPHKSQSFTRLESPRSTPSTRSRASTLQNGTAGTPLYIENTTSPLEDGNSRKGDLFETSSLVSGQEGSLKDVAEIDSPNDIPDDFDELPIELISLIDRFVDSLSAKVHNTPPSIDKVSGLFQDFYVKAESHIATHIQALSTAQARVASPTTSTSSRSSVTTKDSTRSAITRRDTSDSLKTATIEQQMLTPREIADRRKARRILDRKAIALEEAVERRVCERAYDRIWRHRSTLDEVRDEKLRSRTAALALVGISLRDLGIVFEPSNSATSDAAFQSDIEEWISKARDGLLRMNDAKFPSGKLQQLAAAHKAIVDLLTALHQSSSSADEILPTLIYTLITTPPEGINVISNLHFIQRFRAASKVDGEAAYCLTNLEAAITFLETVDLASLRADEALEGPPKSTSRSSTPLSDIQTEIKTVVPSSVPTPSLQSVQPANAILSQPVAPNPIRLAKHSSTHPSSHNRRLSDLLHEPAHAFGAASDVVRNTADHGIKSISGTLDSSFKLLFGRLQEQKKASEGAEADKQIVVPKTLDDARKLVEPKPDTDEEDSSVVRAPILRGKADDSLLNAVAGRKQPRERSVDSAQSSGSGKKLDTLTETTEKQKPTTPSESSFPGNAAVESMRNLGNTLNPLRTFSGIGGLRAFGRTSSSSTVTLATVQSASVPPEKMGQAPQETTSNKEVSDALPPIKVAPPIPKFLEIKSAADLKLGEVSDLLQDYKRLAKALEQLGAL